MINRMKATTIIDVVENDNSIIITGKTLLGVMRAFRISVEDGKLKAEELPSPMMDVVKPVKM